MGLDAAATKIRLWLVAFCDRKKVLYQRNCDGYGNGNGTEDRATKSGNREGGLAAAAHEPEHGQTRNQQGQTGRQGDNGHDSIVRQ